MSNIHYQITPDNLNSHTFKVSLSFASQAGQTYTLSLPAWLPGSYMIRDFARNIIAPVASDSKANPLSLEQLDKQSWHVEASDHRITVCYQVFAFDTSVRSAYLDSQRGFFNGSSTFLAVEQLKASPCRLIINAPDNIRHWRVATALTRSEHTEKYAFGQYQATNYAQLIDGPVALGDFDAVEFAVAGITHHLVFTSEHFGDRARLCRDLTKICQHHLAIFGEMPFQEYWFITHLAANGFGGLEHNNSTILQASRFDLPNPNKPEQLTDNYQTFLSLCSHEYFHAWNVCRIKPEEFVPYDLQQEVYTQQLWAYEGITSYYDDFSLFRSGIIDFDAYLAMLSKTATRVYRGQGELKQSVKQSSFNAWTKFYQQGPDAVNNIVSYYTKGSLIALWLDLTIREKSQGTNSLDDLMRVLWQDFGRTGRGTRQADYINIANRLCGEDIGEQFLSLLNNAERVDLTPLLERVGVKFEQQKFKALNSLETLASDDYIPYLGAQYKILASGLQITSVIEQSPAAQAGLVVNDILLAVNQLKMTQGSLQHLAEHLPQNSKVSCHYFRDDQLLIGQLQFIDCPLVGVQLRLIDKALSLKWQTST